MIKNATATKNRTKVRVELDILEWQRILEALKHDAKGLTRQDQAGHQFGFLNGKVFPARQARDAEV